MTHGAGPVDARRTLERLRARLGDLADDLAEVERRLEPTAIEYQKFIDDFETGLWFQHVNDGAKLPAESLRIKLAHREIDPELLGRYVGLNNSRKRLSARIGSLDKEVRAQISILSALKTEVEATA